MPRNSPFTSPKVNVLLDYVLGLLKRTGHSLGEEPSTDWWRLDSEILNCITECRSTAHVARVSIKEDNLRRVSEIYACPQLTTPPTGIFGTDANNSLGKVSPRDSEPEGKERIFRSE